MNYFPAFHQCPCLFINPSIWSVTFDWSRRLWIIIRKIIFLKIQKYFFNVYSDWENTVIVHGLKWPLSTLFQSIVIWEWDILHISSRMSKKNFFTLWNETKLHYLFLFDSVIFWHLSAIKYSLLIQIQACGSVVNAIKLL